VECTSGRSRVVVGGLDSAKEAEAEVLRLGLEVSWIYVCPVGRHRTLMLPDRIHDSTLRVRVRAAERGRRRVRRNEVGFREARGSKGAEDCY
jgi:hypothetical protein